MFGQKPLFGGTSSSIFGQQTQSTQNIFGTSNPTQAVVPFGQQPQSAATPSLFGQQQPSINNPSTNLFQPQTPGTSAFSFGQTPNVQTTPSFFGGASTVSSSIVGFPSAPQQTPSFFGGASTGGGLFGMATAPQTAGTTIKFKAPTAQDTMYRNGISQNVTIGIQCISAMKEYENKSLEELRLEDYMANRKTASVTSLGLGSTPFQLGQTGSSLFGGTPQSSATTNLFGVNSNPSIFGASSSSFLTSTTPSLFGAAQPSATPSLFGQQTSQPTAATPFQFGVTPQVGSSAPSLFGTGAAKPALFSGFGQPTAPAISTTPGFSFNFGSTVVSTSSSAVPGGFFGGPPTVVSSTTPSFFGATPAQNPLGSNLFGQPVASSTPSLFGFPSAVSTNAPPSLFGQQPQQTSAGGGFSFFGGGNIPGQASAPSAPTGGGSTFNFFGSSSAVTTTSTQAAPSFGAFGFGAASAGSGGFGFPAKTTSSTAPTGFSFFGAPSQTAAVVTKTTTPSLFGFGGGPSAVFGAPQTQLGTGPSFGAVTTSAGGQFSLFQMPQAAPTAVSAPNLFGGGFPSAPAAPGFNMAAPISSTPAPSLFGFGANQTPAFGSSFGATGNTNNILGGGGPFNFGNSSIQPTGFSGSSLFGQSLTTQQPSAPSSGLFGNNLTLVQSQPTQTPQITQSNNTGSLIPSSLSAQTFQNVFSDPTGPLRKQILDMVNLMPYGDVPLGNTSLFLQDSGSMQKSSPSHLPSLFDNNVVDNQKTLNTSSLKGDSIDGRKTSVLFSGLIPTQFGAMRYTPNNNKFSLPTFGFASPKRNSPFLSTSPLRSNSFRLKELFKETPPSPSKGNDGKIRNFDLNDQSIAIIPRNKSANKSNLNNSLLFPSTPFNLFGSGQKNASFIPQHSNLNNVEQNTNGRNLKKLNVKAGTYVSPKTTGNFAFPQKSSNSNRSTTMDFKTSPSRRNFNIEDNPSHLSLSTPGVSRYQSLYPKLTVPDSVFSSDSTDSNPLFSSFHQDNEIQENINDRDLSFISTRDNLSGHSEHDGPSFEQHQRKQFAQINSNTIELFHPSMVEDYYQSNNFYSEDEGEFQLISSDSDDGNKESPPTNKKRSGRTPKTTTTTPGKLQNFSGSNSSLQKRNHQESSLNVNSLLKKLALERPLFKCTKPGYTTAPSVEECYEMYLNNLRKTIVDFYDTDPDMVDKARSRLMINNFTIERKGYGSIMFPGEINVIGLNIDRNVLIDVKDVEIYPDEVEKPILGEEMNRPALITLHNTYPIDKSTLQPIKELDKIIDFNYEKRLRIACNKMGVKFVDYIPHTGTWMFEVSHF